MTKGDDSREKDKGFIILRAGKLFLVLGFIVFWPVFFLILGFHYLVISHFHMGWLAHLSTVFE